MCDDDHNYTSSIDLVRGYPWMSVKLYRSSLELVTYLLGFVSVELLRTIQFRSSSLVRPVGLKVDVDQVRGASLRVITTFNSTCCRYIVGAAQHQLPFFDLITVFSGFQHRRFSNSLEIA